MLEIVPSNRFRRDLKLCRRRGYDLRLLDEVVTRLASGQELDERHRNHMLSGDYSGFSECHIAPDWLLIYQIRENELELFLMRTGTHSDLF